MEAIRNPDPNGYPMFLYPCPAGGPNHGYNLCTVCIPPREYLEPEVGPIIGRVKLPRFFYGDHENRGLPSGRVVSKAARYVTVDLDQEAADDLRGDAAHYAGERDYDPALRASARAVIRALDRAGL